MLIMPIDDVPYQTIQVQLAGQQVKITIRTMATGVFLDLAVMDRPIVSAVLCRDRVRLVRYGYLGFVGDLTFADMQGQSDPVSPGLGSRFLLTYLEAGE